MIHDIEQRGVRRQPTSRSGGRRRCLAPGLAFAAVAVVAATAPPTAGIDSVRLVGELADEFLDAYIARYPEFPTFYGLPGRHVGLTDNSAGAIAAWEAAEDGWLNRLHRIETDALSSTARITHGVLVEHLESARAMRVCRSELWGVSDVTGWQVFLPVVFEFQPVESAQDRDDALQRAGRVAAFVDQEIANARDGLALGYASPARNVDKVITQLAALRTVDSPMYDPAVRGGADPAFAQAFRRVVVEQVEPALHAYETFLRDEYTPRARTAITVAANPHGAACYAATIRAHSGLAIDAATVHRLGLEELASIRAELRTLAVREFGTTDVDALLEQLATGGEYAFDSSDAIVDYAARAYDRAAQALPRWVGLEAPFELEIKPYPSYREVSGTGEYQLPAPDGSRPGVFYIAAHDPGARTRVGIESITFHETVPGHHLQTSIALGGEGDRHPISRYLLSYGYTEGWALYAERLAAEMGLYGDAADLVGMLSDQAARAARLVIDTGIHEFGWSRDRAVEFMTANTTWSAVDIEAEIDRYIIWPGQATAYMLGYLEIRRLRGLAEQELGEAFDVREFHDRIIEDGQITLGLMRDKIDAWIRRPRDGR